MRLLKLLFDKVPFSYKVNKAHEMLKANRYKKKNKRLFDCEIGIPQLQKKITSAAGRDFRSRLKTNTHSRIN